MKTRIITSFTIIFMVVFALTGCYEVPDSIYTPVDPEEENANAPSISSVDKTYMWTDETLTITGENFSDSTDENFVYFSSVSEPVPGDTTVTVDSVTAGGTYNVTTNFKDIDIATSDYVTTITSTINGTTTITDYREPTVTEEYTVSTADQLVLTRVETVPVFTSIDTSVVGGETVIDTTGYTRMTRTVTSYNNISEWTTHSAEPATVVSASSTELQVIPPDIDVINSLITVHVQDVVAPAEWGYIDLMVKP